MKISIHQPEIKKRKEILKYVFFFLFAAFLAGLVTAAYYGSRLGAS